MKEYKVYVLVDPLTLKVRYIGITKSKTNIRLQGHLSDCKTDREKNTYKKNWIRSILRVGSHPIIRCITSYDTREEAAQCEYDLIIKHKDKHKLTNEIVDEGKFSKEGHRSAEKILSKTIYVYNYEGQYLSSYKSRKEASITLNITYSSVKKCLSGEYKYVKGYQFSSTKVETMLDLTEHSRGSSEEVFIRDNTTQEVTRYKSCVDMCQKLSIPRTVTNIKQMLGTLNRYHGNKYSMLVDDKYCQSTYWNTGVSIECENTTYNFPSRKELFQSMGYKSSGIAEAKLIKLIQQNFKQVKNITFNKPLCEVTHIDNM